MAFSIFTDDTTITTVSLGTFSSPQRNPVSFHSPALSSCKFTFVSTDLPILDLSYKRSYRTRGLR